MKHFMLLGSQNLVIKLYNTTSVGNMYLNVSLFQDSSAEFEVQVFNNPDITVHVEITQDHVKLRFPSETVRFLPE